VLADVDRGVELRVDDGEPALAALALLLVPGGVDVDAVVGRGAADGAEQPDRAEREGDGPRGDARPPELTSLALGQLHPQPPPPAPLPPAAPSRLVST
jgi:hypothetical protein